MPRTETCTVCHGSGAKPGTTPKQCTRCGGTGQLRQSQRTAFGMFTQVTTCHRCRGQGTLVEAYCPECNGRGTIQKTRNIELRIPPGVDDGSQLRLAGEGEAGESGGNPGDLYVVVHLKDHPQFSRNGSDLHLIKDISFPDAALGAKIQVRTLEGNVETLRIPEGTQNGDVFKISQRGMPRLRGRGYGDLFVQVKVKTPQHLSRKAKRLLEGFQEETERK